MFESYRWRALAETWVCAIAQGSKDHSTKVGAIIFRPNKSVASVGFNGFPPGVYDDPDILGSQARRDEKLALMIHAEGNAFRHAVEPLQGYSMVVSHHPCSKCAQEIVDNGIKEVLYIYDLHEKWADDVKKAKSILESAKVELIKSEFSE